MSWYVDHYVLSTRDIIGVLVALSGAYAYAHHVLKAA
jgi:hypothetical protein